MSFLPRLFDAQESPGSGASSRRILLNPEVLKSSKIFAGDIVLIQHEQNFVVGIAWPSADIETEAVQLSPSQLLAANLSPGSKVQIAVIPPTRPQSGSILLPTLLDIQEARVVTLTQVGGAQKQENSANPKEDWLALYLREHLLDLRYLAIQQRVNFTFRGRNYDFVVDTASGAQDLANAMNKLSLTEMSWSGRIWSTTWSTVVKISRPPQHKNSEDVSKPTLPPPKVGYDEVGGLDRQIAEVRDLIDLPLSHPHLFREFGLKPPRGILLHGPPGTGKTHLARAIAASTESATLLAISGPELSSAYHGETESKLRAVFEEAKLKSPCIIVLDEVDAICPKREDVGGGGVEGRVVTTLLTLMDGVGEGESNGGGRVVVVATTNRPNAIDPALRRPGRFDREIEIGIPDAPARLSILKVLLRKAPSSLTTEELESIAKRTHGYVGADLSAVVRDAGTLAIKRSLSSSSTPTLTLPDLLHSLSSVRPSALREHFIESPSVRWIDIGGQASVKQKLKECIELPLLHPHAFERLGVTPPRGVLMYGPPGCSKTLAAKALATESGINFISVKGPELLNKYVGESERSIREVFRKARGAAPSIIFFDEIDALSSSRSSEGGGRPHEGVLTSLLTEMDGIQELVGVTVVAATNRPDVIDSALMRPGRLDRILYVGPPDKEARIEILKIRVQKMSVDEELDLLELAELTDGCSGAEIVSMCQDAALLTMQENIDSPFVTRKHFLASATSVRKGITQQVIDHYDRWRASSGLPSA